MQATPAKLSQSAKKRQRNEVDEDLHGAAEGDAKRQNTTKTPVRMKGDKKEGKPEENVRERPNMIVSRYKEVSMPPPRRGGDNIISSMSKEEDTADKLLVPPPPKAMTDEGAGQNLAEKKKATAVKSASGNETTNQKSWFEENHETVIPEAAAGSRGKWSVVLVSIIIVLIASAFAYGYISATLTLNELKHDLQNCLVLQTPQKMEAETYIKELETQLRAWKQEAKAKDAEIKSLRDECPGL